MADVPPKAREENTLSPRADGYVGAGAQPAGSSPAGAGVLASEIEPQPHAPTKGALSEPRGSSSAGSRRPAPFPPGHVLRSGLGGEGPDDLLGTTRDHDQDRNADAGVAAPLQPAAPPRPVAGPRAQGVNDQPALADTIGFAPYVDALAQLLVNDATVPPLTVSLEGEWGSGKSTFLRQLRAAIETRSPNPNRRPIFVEFNAWRHDKDEALWASFALAFARQVKPAGLRRALCDSFTLTWRRIDRRAAAPAFIRAAVLAFLLVVLGGVLLELLLAPVLKQDGVPAPGIFEGWWKYFATWTPIAFASSPLIAALASLAKKLAHDPLTFDLKRYISVPDYKGKLGLLERFHEDFEAQAATYLRGRGRVFVVVDDLDRCEVPKAAELLQALNLMLAGTLPLVVIVAMDRQKVASGVAVRHKELIPFLPRIPGGPDEESEKDAERRVGIAYGYEFVEKFIQLPLRIPKLTEAAVPRFLDSLLEAATAQSVERPHRQPPTSDVVTTDGPEVRRVMERVAPALGHNPRRLKQWLNLFRFRYLVASNTGQLKSGDAPGLTLTQLGKLVAVELRWPTFLDRLLERPWEADDLFRAAKGPFEGLSNLLRDGHLLQLLWSKEEAEAQETVLHARAWLPKLYGSGVPDRQIADRAAQGPPG